jgi:hypothetical protein
LNTLEETDYQTLSYEPSLFVIAIVAKQDSRDHSSMHGFIVAKHESLLLWINR